MWKQAGQQEAFYKQLSRITSQKRLGERMNIIGQHFGTSCGGFIMKLLEPVGDRKRDIGHGLMRKGITEKLASY